MVHTLRLDNYSPTPRKLVLGTNSSFGTESIKIERGAGWDGLNLTATWHIPGREEPLRVALLDGDAMDVPPEVTKEAKDGVLVLAGLASGVQRASCNVDYLILEQAGVYGGADAEPTPELAAQVLEAALQAKADAEAAAEEAAEAKARAEEAQAASAAAKEAAEAAAADAAKAGPYAEAALAAQRAAEAARDKAITAQQAAENAAAAANYAGQSASDAAASKAAAEIAAQAAQEAQAAAAAARDDAVKAQTAAQTAAKSAQDAKAAAEKARDDAKAAQKGTEAARDAAAGSAEAAAKSEANAKQSADTLAESVENVAANTTAVAELKEKKAEIDDTAVGANAWSSKHIIDMLCPPLEESGNPVVCYPVAGYPLGVKASWEPVQEGSGTPSPENIRPIKGRDSVRVERCGENLLPHIFDKIPDMVTKDGLTIVKTPKGTIHVSGKKTGTNWTDLFRIKLAESELVEIPAGTYSWGSGVSLVTNHGNIHTSPSTIDTPLIITGAYAAVNTAGTYNKDYIPALVAGSEEPTKVEPYQGSTNTLTLPETVYGGEVDAVTGEGQDTQKLVILNGTESWNSWGINAYNPAITGFYTYDINDYDAKNTKVICSHLETPNQDVWGGRNAGIGFATVGSSRYFMLSMLTSSLPDISAGHEVASLKAYLAAQNDAGTPVQIAYKLATPTPFTATGAQPIPALAGVNTVLTDADSATVTGRADPIKRIEDLEAAVASIN